jgi:hypothetical protein
MTVLQLSDEWIARLTSQPETGMDYQVVLRDARTRPRSAQAG